MLISGCFRFGLKLSVMPMLVSMLQEKPFLKTISAPKVDTTVRVRAHAKGLFNEIHWQETSDLESTSESQSENAAMGCADRGSRRHLNLQHGTYTKGRKEVFPGHDQSLFYCCMINFDYYVFGEKPNKVKLSQVICKDDRHLPSGIKI